MSKRIEDYGLIGNTITAALVARDGSIDWTCLPRFDSDACFAALLGDPEHGCWQIAPAREVLRVSRSYRHGTAVLETHFETPEGKASIIDFMPFTDDERLVDIVRIVCGHEGRVELRMALRIRFGFGRIVPWVRHQDYGISAVAGPAAVALHTPVDVRGEDWTTVADFAVEAGERVPFTLAYHESHRDGGRPRDPERRLEETERRWRAWSERCSFDREETHPWRQAVKRSLITLKALTFSPTGGMVAAPTTSLPEEIGGARNWDYRFCWIRDATLALYSLLMSGFRGEAREWRRWLLRAAAGDPHQLQILYGLGGERRLTEIELPWLPGYERSTPVRAGNAAFEQRQLDVPGELMDALHVGREFELEFNDHAWSLQKAMLRRLEADWDQPGEGIWEIRGEKLDFTFSRVMCWVAFDRALRGIEKFGLPGPAERWRRICGQIRADIQANGWCERKQSYVQHYGGECVDASLLLMAQVGFVSPHDTRFRSTVAAIERELLVDGLVRRYRTDQTPDGLPGDEGSFLACSFWLADAYVMLGRYDDAVEQFERLLDLRNDLGLLSEQYDPVSKRQIGNFPQAFSHVALINTAHNLISARGPAAQRAKDAHDAGHDDVSAQDL